MNAWLGICASTPTLLPLVAVSSWYFTPAPIALGSGVTQVIVFGTVVAEILRYTPRFGPEVNRM